MRDSFYAVWGSHTGSIFRSTRCLIHSFTFAPVLARCSDKNQIVTHTEIILNEHRRTFDFQIAPNWFCFCILKVGETAAFGMTDFATRMAHLPMDTWKTLTAPGRATFEVVSNFLSKLREQSGELDAAEHGAIISDEIALCRKRSALISLFAVDIPFLIIRMITHWYMLRLGKAFDLPPFTLKNIVCILLQATQLKMAQQASSQTASRWLNLGHQRRWMKHQMNVIMLFLLNNESEL